MAVFIKRWFLNNPGLKALSLILAVLLWFYIVGEQAEELEVEMPLEITPPQGMRVVSVQDDTLDVVLKGPRNVIRMISASGLSAYHKIEELQSPGEYIFTITPGDISRLPREVKVVRIDPPQVMVRLDRDRLIRRHLPIRANIEGAPAAGFEVSMEKISLNPTTASVAGPESVLGKLSYIRTAPIDVEGATKTFVKKVTLEPIPGQRSMEEVLIEVTIPIQEVFTERIYEGVEVKILWARSKAFLAEVSPSRVDLALAGPGLSLEMLEASKILAFVDVGELGKGKYKLPLKVILPEAIRLVSEIPTIEVTLQEPSPLGKK